MKKIKNLKNFTLLLLLFSLIALYSCLTDDNEKEAEINISKISTISFDIDNYNFLRNEKAFEKTED